MNSIKTINKQLKDGLKSVLSKDKKNIVFLSHSLDTRCAYGQLPSALMDCYNVIMIGAERVQDDFEKMGHAFIHIPCKVDLQGEVQYTSVDVDGIDLIITADSIPDQGGKVDQEFLSKKAKRLFVSPELFSSHCNHAAFDHIAISSKYAMDICQKDAQLSQKLLEVGSLRFDELSKKAAQQNMQPMITYMPASRPIPRSYVNMNFVAGHENMLLEWLLTHTDMKISYKLHASGLLKAPHYYMQLKEQWKGEERITFDESLNDDHWITSKAVLSDFSPDVYLFSLAALRNAVYLVTDVKAHKPFLDKTLEQGVVRIAHGLKDAVNQLVSPANEKDLMSIMKQQIYHIGHAQSKIMEHINRILD